MKEIKEPEKSCRLGQGSPCCIFLVVGSNGFECVKHTGSSIEKTLLKRLFMDTTNAKGIGDWEECKNK